MTENSCYFYQEKNDETVFLLSKKDETHLSHNNSKTNTSFTLVTSFGTAIVSHIVNLRAVFLIRLRGHFSHHNNFSKL